MRVKQTIGLISLISAFLFAGSVMALAQSVDPDNYTPRGQTQQDNASPWSGGGG